MAHNTSVKRKAIFAGSFDPPTKGHEWIIKQGAELFDELIIAVGTNPEKQLLFTLAQKTEMLKLIAQPYPNVSTSEYENELLVTYAKNRNAQFILRGIRTEEDLRYEKSLQAQAHAFDPTLRFIYLIAPKDLELVSSSLVRSVLGTTSWETDILPYVSSATLSAFRRFKHSQ